MFTYIIIICYSLSFYGSQVGVLGGEDDGEFVTDYINTLFADSTENPLTSQSAANLMKIILENYPETTSKDFNHQDVIDLISLTSPLGCDNDNIVYMTNILQRFYGQYPNLQAYIDYQWDRLRKLCINRLSVKIKGKEFYKRQRRGRLESIKFDMRSIIDSSPETLQIPILEAFFEPIEGSNEWYKFNDETWVDYRARIVELIESRRFQWCAESVPNSILDLISSMRIIFNADDIINSSLDADYGQLKKEVACEILNSLGQLGLFNEYIVRVYTTRELFDEIFKSHSLREYETQLLLELLKDYEPTGSKVESSRNILVRKEAARMMEIFSDESKCSRKNIQRYVRASSDDFEPTKTYITNALPALVSICVYGTLSDMTENLDMNSIIDFTRQISHEIDMNSETDIFPSIDGDTLRGILIEYLLKKSRPKSIIDLEIFAHDFEMLKQICKFYIVEISSYKEELVYIMNSIDNKQDWISEVIAYDDFIYPKLFATLEGCQQIQEMKLDDFVIGF